MLGDGTRIKSRKCEACKTQMCSAGGYYYCPNKSCERFDVPQKNIEDADIVERGPVKVDPFAVDIKPEAMVGPWCDVTRRKNLCSTCRGVAYVITTNTATVTVCKCGVSVGSI